MKKIFLLIIFAISANSSYAQQAYVCVANSSSGFKYDKNIRKWESTKLIPSDDKKLLKKDVGGWSWASFGSGYPERCGEINKYGVLNCQTFFGSLIFDKDTLRYMETYMAGYVDGDREGNTPSITIGKCSPL